MCTGPQSDLTWTIVEVNSTYYVRFHTLRGSKWQEGPFTTWQEASQAGDERQKKWDSAPRGFQVGD